MSSTILPFGTQNAPVVPFPSYADQTKPISTTIVAKTVGELLIILRNQPPPYFGFLKTACSHLGTYLNQPTDQLTFETIAAHRSGFRSFLKSRGYAENSITQYVYQTNVLLKTAQKHGWDPDRAISQAWKTLLATAAKEQVFEITKYFSRITKTPGEITIEALNSWEDSKLRAGIFYASARSTRNRFLGFLHRSGWSKLQFPGIKKLENYGVLLDDMAPELSAELRMLLKWKQADFAINRPKRGKIRAVSAEKLSGTFCQLCGYATNICDFHPISVKELVQQSVVEGFVEWMINERGVNGRSFKQSLGSIYAVVRYHSSFATVDFKWFQSLLDSIPVEDDSERRDRKARKHVDYEVLEAIPYKMRTERRVQEKKRRGAKKIACLAMEELVMLWLTILPWRQRNVRQCRIVGLNPNLFKSKIRASSALDKPDWVIEEEKGNPNAEFWQVQFSTKETKTGIPIHILLPHQLIGPVEEYLAQHRPKLLGDRNVDTLLVNSIGNPLNSKLMQRVVGHWTLQYASLRTTPHLFRDAVAFQWLKEHPADYLTLSKMLWHKSIETTIRIYGSQFNESSGVRAMEEWREARDSKFQ